MISRASLFATMVLAVWLMACGPTPGQLNNSGMSHISRAIMP